MVSISSDIQNNWTVTASFEDHNEFFYMTRRVYLPFIFHSFKNVHIEFEDIKILRINNMSNSWFGVFNEEKTLSWSRVIHKIILQTDVSWALSSSRGKGKLLG